MRHRTAIAAVILLSCAAATLPAQKTSLFKLGAPKAGERDIGIIFNTTDLLLNLESYQGGLGGKIGVKDWELRGLADFGLHVGVNPSSFNLGLGAVLEKHLTPGPISVYWGPSVGTAMNVITNKTDEDNWTQSIFMDLLAAGAVLGVEVFVFDFLSVFVEYQVEATLGLNVYRNSVAGSVSSSTEWAGDLGVALGNDAMFGIVFYFQRRAK